MVCAFLASAAIASRECVLPVVGQYFTFEKMICPARSLNIVETLSLILTKVIAYCWQRLLERLLGEPLLPVRTNGQLISFETHTDDSCM